MYTQCFLHKQFSSYRVFYEHTLAIELSSRSLEGGGCHSSWPYYHGQICRGEIEIVRGEGITLADSRSLSGTGFLLGRPQADVSESADSAVGCPAPAGLYARYRSWDVIVYITFNTNNMHGNVSTVLKYLALYSTVLQRDQYFP